MLQVLVELCNVMHRQLLTQESVSVQAAVIAVISQAVTAALEQLANTKKNKLKELFPANQSITEVSAGFWLVDTILYWSLIGQVPAEVAVMGEGGEDGIIKPGKCVSFAVLEVINEINVIN